MTKRISVFILLVRLCDSKPFSSMPMYIFHVVMPGILTYSAIATHCSLQKDLIYGLSLKGKNAVFQGRQGIEGGSE